MTTTLNYYTMLSHWKSSLAGVTRPNRNGRKYVKTCLPGKPKASSLPLWIILKRLFQTHTGQYPTARHIRHAYDVCINGKRTRDDRAAVMIGDHVTIGADDYRFQLFRHTARQPITYRLVPQKVPQKLIVAKQVVRDGLRLSCINGQRRMVRDVDVGVGSVWTPEKILGPQTLRYFVRLTGKYKFIFYPIVQRVVEPDRVILTIRKEHDREQKVVVDWQTLSMRKYLLLS